MWTNYPTSGFRLQTTGTLKTKRIRYEFESIVVNCEAFKAKSIADRCNGLIEFCGTIITISQFSEMGIGKLELKTFG